MRRDKPLLHRTVEFVRLIPAFFTMARKDGCPFLMDRDHEPKMKKVDGEEHPASDFAYVPDPEKPSTWKLPIFNMHHVGGALAAMTSDYRGNPVEIPEGDRHAVMKKILARKAELEQEEKLTPASCIPFFFRLETSREGWFSPPAPLILCHPAG